MEALFDRIIAGAVIQPQELEFRGADGVTVLLEVSRHPLSADGEWFIVAVGRDITERKKAEAELRQLAHYDSLTGLPNRRRFRESLGRAMERADALGHQVVLMYLDLDDFKDVNDSLGHAGGDDLLREAAIRLSGAVYPRDTVGRLGGDEFGIILVTPRDTGVAMRAARRIQRALLRPFDLAGHSVHVAASIGMSLYPADATRIEDLERNADLAMYDAKREGRNETRFYTSQMNDRMRDKLAMDKALRVALERGEFELHYQPKASLRTGKWVGAEALLRWNRPDHGLVPPGDFIGALEESGLIVAVGAWVVSEACRQMTTWEAAGIGPMPVAVNVSALQIARPGPGSRNFDAGTAAAAGMQLIQAAKQCMSLHSVPEGMLEMEITESAVMADADHNISVLREMKSLGVRLAVDDFGTGYSSLAYLRRFPLDSLKIDGTFVQGATTSAEDASIALAIIEMAHRLNLRVIAECVETREQAEFLRLYGCDEAQGYLISRPLRAEEFSAKWHESQGIAPGIADRPELDATSGARSEIDSMPMAWIESKAFEVALLDGNRRDCEVILRRMIAQGHGLAEIGMRVMQPALYSIGQKWFLNGISVAEEHLATVTATAVLTELAAETECLVANGRKILLACVEGNHHSLGLQMTAEVFRIDGWDVRLLGANVPTESVVRHVRAWRPDVVAVSTSLSQQIPALTDLLSKLRDATGDAGPHLLVGGLALATAESRRAVLLADGWAGDCARALQVATSLCEGDPPLGRKIPASVAD